MTISSVLNAPIYFGLMHKTCHQMNLNWTVNELDFEVDTMRNLKPTKMKDKAKTRVKLIKIFWNGNINELMFGNDLFLRLDKCYFLD